MEKRNNWQEFKNVLEQHGITTLYHFTDRGNLESVIRNGGLYSWADCEEKGIRIEKPGSSMTSRELDRRDGLQHYVRVSFTRNHPMMYVAMNDGRISNPVILEIDPEVIFDKATMFADRNATKTGACVGNSLDDFKRIHFDSVKAAKHFDLDVDEQMFYQAEVLVKNFIPLQYIRNIGSFGIPVPNNPQVLQERKAYTAQVTRNTPTAFIFVVDHSVSMNRKTELFGENMTMAEAVARIVNKQINELVLRCVKNDEVRHYYDIAVVGYGEEAYMAWQGELAGRDFVTPQELLEHPFKKITVREEKRTRKGTVVKEVEKVQWLEARHSGRCTHINKALDKTMKLLENWLEQHRGKNCYPPTVIHITDGEFNGTTKENIVQMTNELKSMYTNDGNVLFFNIHIANAATDGVAFPIEKQELAGNKYAETLFEISSLLPLRYNEDIARLRQDDDFSLRHAAMSVNTDMGTLIQLMDIGTPTNISHDL